MKFLISLFYVAVAVCAAFASTRRGKSANDELVAVVAIILKVILFPLVIAATAGVTLGLWIDWAWRQE